MGGHGMLTHGKHHWISPWPWRCRTWHLEVCNAMLVPTMLLARKQDKDSTL